ncbi:MAG: diguanylate cyclase [Desulfobacula sp.]|nr:diguanylate cyclase [Desulfobacula sp.]
MKLFNPFLFFFKKHPQLFFLFLTPIIFIFIALGIYTQKNKVILPGFLAFEKKVALHQLGMVNQTINHQIHDLEMLTTRWIKKEVVQAVFINTPNFKHRPFSIDSDALKTDLPLVQLISIDGGRLYAKGIDLNDQMNQAFKTFQKSVIRDENNFKSTMEGLFWTIIPSPKGPMMVCAGKYFAPNKTKARGIIFLGQLFSKHSLYPVNSPHNIDIQLSIFQNKKDRQNPAPVLSNIQQKKYHIEFAETYLTITSPFLHPFGTPLLLSKIKIDRDILIPVNKIARFASLSILIVGTCMWIYFIAAFLITHNHLKKQKHEIELRLGQTKDHFSKVFQSKAVFIAITTIDDERFVDINSEFLKALGYKKDEVIGKTTEELSSFADESQRKAFFDQIRNDGFIRDFDLILQTKNKKPLHVSISADIIQFQSSDCLLSVLIDISDRKYLEGELKKALFKASQMTADAEIKNYQLELEIGQRNQAELLNQALFDISNAINTTVNLEDLYGDIHKIMGTILTLNNFYIALYFKKQDYISFPYWRDEQDSSYEDIYDISKKESLTFKVIKSKKPLLIKNKDISKGGKLDGKTIGVLAQAWLGVPLKIKGEVIGALVTQSYTDQERFNQNDINLLVTVSDQVALAIERKKAQQALLLSEKKHRSIIEGVKDGYCETDVNGTIVFFNEALCEITGYPGDTLSGKKFSDLLTDQDQAIDIFKQAFEEDRVDSNFQIIKKNGIKKHIGIRPAPIEDENGKRTGFRTFVRDIDEQKKYERKLVFLAYHDALTGLNNRKAFYEHLEQCLQTAQRNQTKLAVMYMDIDKFKQVNDTLGHEAGDDLLKTISKRLNDNLRETDFISRIGGDEFTVIMTSNASFHPEELAKKILGAIRFPYDFDVHTIDYITASIGISLYPDDTQDIEGLVKKADQAMYEAKKEGNSFVFFPDH